MSEPSSSVPEEVANADVESRGAEQERSVELDLDQDKVEAWDEVKSAYQVDPGGEPVPNSMDVGGPDQSGDEAEEPAVSASSSPDDAEASEGAPQDEDDVARGSAPPPG